MDCPQLAPRIDSREPIILFLAFAIIMGYMFVLWTSMQTDSEHTVFGFGTKCRKIWTEAYLEKPKLCLSAIQAIRNEILTLLFIGETSFSAVTVIITVSSALDLTCSMEAMSSQDPITGGMELWFSPMSKIKLIISLLTGIFAFTLQSLRLLRHASVIATCSDTVAKEECKGVLYNMYGRISSFNFLAMRAIYLLIPALALLLGPTFALAATLLTTAFMHATDHITLPKPHKLFKEVRRRGSVLASGAARRVSSELKRAGEASATAGLSSPVQAVRRSFEMARSSRSTGTGMLGRDGQGQVQVAAAGRDSFNSDSLPGPGPGTSSSVSSWSAHVRRPGNPVAARLDASGPGGQALNPSSESRDSREQATC